MTAASLPDGRLAGYRLVRKLGGGSRADVYLGIGSTGSVALKVFAPETSREDAGAELDALGRLESPHLVKLLDVASSPTDLPILVLQRLGQDSVGSLLSVRPSLECGEAVTLLAPIAGLVGELHAVGVAHGRIAPTSIHFGTEGEPVLLGLGHCELFAQGGTMAAIDADPAAARDRDALAELALSVLARVRHTGAERRVSDLTYWIESASRAYEFPGELAERLFAAAEALPVSRLVNSAVESAVPTRVVPATPPRTTEQGVAVEDSAREPPAWLAGILGENPIELLRRRALAAARGVRPRFWVAGGVVAVALMAGIALIPSGGSSRQPPAKPEPVVTVVAPPPTPSPLPDDPLLASKILLAARETCFRDLSILCLDEVDEASSGAFTTDAALIQQVQNGGEIPRVALIDGATLTLVEKLGDTVLIGATVSGQTTSLVVIRTKAGWRIRDVLSGAQATPTP